MALLYKYGNGLDACRVGKTNGVFAWLYSFLQYILGRGVHGVFLFRYYRYPLLRLLLVLELGDEMDGYLIPGDFS